MKTRFSPVALACTAALSFMSLQVHAGSPAPAKTAVEKPAQPTFKVPELTNNASLSTGMTTSAARTYDALNPAAMSALTAVKRPNGNVGTDGAGNGSDKNGTTTNGTTVSNNGGGNGGGNGDGNNSSSPAMPKPQVNPGLAGLKPQVNPGVAGFPVGNDIGGTDWLKVVQVAAPILASATGNQKFITAAGIVGSGANVYDAVTSGRELTGANYVNITNLVVQTAAVVTKDPNLIKAAAVTNTASSVLNVYSAMTPTKASTAGGAMTQIGKTETGQAVYRTPSGETVVVSGVTANGAPIYQIATSSAVQPSGSTWGPTATGTQPTRTVDELLNTTNERSYAPGSPSEKAAMLLVNNKLDAVLAGTGPVDNYDLQNVPSGGVDNYDLQGRQPGSDVDNYDLQGGSANSTRVVRQPYRVTTKVASKPLQTSSSTAAAEPQFPAFTTKPYTEPTYATYFADQAVQKADLERRIAVTGEKNKRVGGIAKGEAEAEATELASKFNWQ